MIESFPAQVFRLRGLDLTNEKGALDRLSGEIEAGIQPVPEIFTGRLADYDDAFEARPLISEGDAFQFHQKISEYWSVISVHPFWRQVIKKGNPLGSVPTDYSMIDIVHRPRFLQVMRLGTLTHFSLVRQSARTVCLSREFPDGRMWSQYASLSSGVALKYELSGDHSIAEANMILNNVEGRFNSGDVSYLDKRPTITDLDSFVGNISRGGDPSLQRMELLFDPARKGELDVYQKSFFAKPVEFRGESEFRLIHFTGDMYRPIYPFRLTRVICGHRMKYRIQNLVRSIAEKFGVAVSRSAPNGISYRLEDRPF